MQIIQIIKNKDEIIKIKNFTFNKAPELKTKKDFSLTEFAHDIWITTSANKKDFFQIYYPPIKISESYFAFQHLGEIKINEFEELLKKYAFKTFILRN